MTDAAKDRQPVPGGKPETAPQHEELQQLRALWKNHGVSLLVAVAVALVAVSGGILYRNHMRRSLEEASRSLASVRSAQDLENLITRQPSAAVAPLAMMKLAKAYFDAGNYDLALSKYQEFGAKHPSHPMASVSEMGRISCLEAKGQKEEAAKAYREFAQQHPDDFLVPQAVLGEGRCLEALERPDKARTVYEDFIAAKPESGWKPRVEELLENINKKLTPVGAATNLPPAASETNAAAGAD